MASMLRTGKFVRYIVGFTKSCVFNSTRETEERLFQNTHCLCDSLKHCFSTAVPKPNQGVDKFLKRLDQDVRRTGRISRRDIEEVFEEIRQQRSATSSQSLLVIRCCGNLVPEELPEVRTALVQEIWKTLNSLNVPMDISHYNALLRVYLENEHPFSPADFLSDLETKGVEPNRVTYQRLIACYCQQGDIEGATRILEFMREREMPVNENVFNALILGHSQANDLQSAAGILVVMKQAGLEPTAETYSTLLCCYARHGQLESLMTTIEECEKNEIYFLDKDILDVVYALAINGHADKIDQVLNKLRKSTGYNQDAVNVILRLINKGYVDVAYKVLKTMPRNSRADGTLNDAGNFFIRQLVKAGSNTDKILQICKDMEENGLHSKPLLVAVEAGLHMGAVDSTLSLFHEIKSTGAPIRQHYFWPLICASPPDKILEILKKMQTEFEVRINGETLQDYIIPNMNETNPDRLINKLCDAGISPAAATSAVVYNLLSLSKLKDAAFCASKIPSYYSPALFRKPLIAALANTNDVESFLKFVRHFYDGLSRQTVAQQSQSDISKEANYSQKDSQADQLGALVYDLVNYFRQNRVEKMEKILSGLVAEGLSISSMQAEKIQEKFGSEMTTKISELLGKLSSGELEPTAGNENLTNRKRGLQMMSIPQIEKILVAAEAKNENTNGLKRVLLAACFRSKDLKKTEEVIGKLEDEDYVLGGGVYAQLIDLYCHHKDVENALRVYDKMKSQEPDFVLDNLKAMHVADLMIKNGKLNEAIQFLENNKKDELHSEEKNFNYKTSCWRILNDLAESGNEEGLQILFNTLVENNYIEPSNVMLGPLIKVHLTGEEINLKKALDKFEEACNKYQATPWKNELACRLIQAEDAVNLQRLTDLSTTIHGEVNSLYDLVFSFIECGRIRQARKILETPGLRSRPQRINAVCERYRTEGMVQSLEGLIEATKDLNHIDRADIYFNLLCSYRKNGETEKALGLWTKMQEEDITPTDEFLMELAEFLREKKMNVPFVVPNDKWTKPKEVSHSERKELKQHVVKDKLPKGPSLIQQYRDAIKRGDLDVAKSILDQLGAGTKLTIGDYSLMLEALVKNELLNEASNYLFNLLEQQILPSPRIFKFALNKFANAGDYGVIEKLGNLITDDTKRLISFNNRLCHAHIVAGNGEIYLNGLLEEFENANTEEETKLLAEKFPRGGALGILETLPHLYPKFEELATRYASKNYLGPMNICWIHHVVNKNHDESKKIWDKYLSSHPQLMFQRVMQTARITQDEEIMQKLIETLRTGKVSEGAIGNAYSCWLDVLSGKEKFDEALEVLNAAVKDICLENINKTALMRLRDGLVKGGKQFPYKIPDRSPKNDSSSSSSSGSSSSDSSDDDLAKVKRPEGPPRPDPKF